MGDNILTSAREIDDQVLALSAIADNLRSILPITAHSLDTIAGSINKAKSEMLVATGKMVARAIQSTVAEVHEGIE